MWRNTKKRFIILSWYFAGVLGRGVLHCLRLEAVIPADCGTPGQETMQEQERWLSVEEISAHLGSNRDTVYKWIDRKRMPAHKL